MLCSEVKVLLVTSFTRISTEYTYITSAHEHKLSTGSVGAHIIMHALVEVGMSASNDLH